MIVVALIWGCTALNDDDPKTLVPEIEEIEAPDEGLTEAEDTVGSTEPESSEIECPHKPYPTEQDVGSDDYRWDLWMHCLAETFEF